MYGIVSEMDYLPARRCKVIQRFNGYKFAAWHPGLEDIMLEEWTDGEGPPEFLEETEEPEVPDPNMEGMPTIWGYEDCDFDKKKKERPPHEHHRIGGEPVPQEIKNVGVPSEEECRQAITTFVESNPCFGKEPINTLVINNILAANAFTYTLETFVEKRKVGYEYKPYKGGEIDDPAKGRAPETWEIEVTFKHMFKKEDEKIEVPHTSTVRTCHYCCGQGFVHCAPCKGWGCYVCPHCPEFASTEEAPEEAPEAEVAVCSSCNDSHRMQCVRCTGSGKRVCPACDGYRAIRCFIQLKVKFKNYKEEYIREDTDLPDHLIKEVKGATVFEQTGEQLAPIEGFPIPEINSKSQQFFSKHRLELLHKKRLLQQRQKLVAVPVAEVHVTWKEKTGRYWVYGKENKVHCPDYPDQCACCCIL